MAVYTVVGIDDARPLIAALGLGELQALEGVPSGIENTNYFATTDRGVYVLTLFERLAAHELPFYLRFMQHLAQRGLPVPEPQADAQGELLHHLCGKPAAVAPKLDGEPIEAPDLHHAAQIGAALARMHLAGADFPLSQPNLRGLPWCVQVAPTVRPYLTAAQVELLDEELAFQTHMAASPAYASLPRGPVHADLFRDNALFNGLPGRERLSALFDFYFAGTDTWLYDLAVGMNDWCIDLESGRLDEARAASLIDAYESERPLEGAEARCLPALRRAGALRFWLSRLADWHLPRAASLLTPKDPSHFERVLRACIAMPWHPAADQD